MIYHVVEAKVVANDVEGLSDWLNRMANRGWTVTAVDQGFIYLAKAVKR